MEVDKYQKKKFYTIEQLVNMQIDVPEVEDIDKVSSIIDYQVNHYEKQKTFCFLGDLTIYSSTDSSSSWLIIDGMHRYLAMKNPRIYELHPTYKVSLNIISGSKGFTLEDAFRLLNMTSPIPSSYVTSSLHKSKQITITDVRRFVYKEYKSYISKSKHPRPPNFSLESFMHYFIESPLLDTLKSLDMVIGYIKYANLQLGSTCPRKIKLRIDKKFEKFNLNLMVYFSSDISCRWMFNTNWIQKYVNEKYEKSTDEKLKSEPSKDDQLTEGKRKRTSLPKVMRSKIWTKYYGQHMEGICKCCEMNKISFVDFDAGHIVSHKDGGSNTIGNLVPVCRPCNLGMGTENMNSFAKRMNPDAKNISEWTIPCEIGF